MAGDIASFDKARFRRKLAAALPSSMDRNVEVAISLAPASITVTADIFYGRGVIAGQLKAALDEVTKSSQVASQTFGLTVEAVTVRPFATKMLRARDGSGSNEATVSRMYADNRDMIVLAAGTVGCGFILCCVICTTFTCIKRWLNKCRVARARRRARREMYQQQMDAFDLGAAAAPDELGRPSDGGVTLGQPRYVDDDDW